MPANKIPRFALIAFVSIGFLAAFGTSTPAQQLAPIPHGQHAHAHRAHGHQAHGHQARRHHAHQRFGGSHFWPLRTSWSYQQRRDYANWVYPKYTGGFHASYFQSLGVPPGDVGLRGNGIYATPW